MQNIHKIQISISVLALAFILAFFASTSTAFAQVATHNTGTVRICSVLANSGGTLAAADTTVPTGTFTLSLATTTNFSSPVATHAFNAQGFAHNTTVDSVPMHCTDAVTVPFGQYYYNNVSVSGAGWSPSRYFDSTSPFSVAAASLYTNGLFTTDTSDDVLINTTSDGLVVVNETTPNRTIIVLNTFTPVLESVVTQLTTLPPAQCLPGVNMISNPGFEKPVVNNPALWTSIPLGTPDFFWTSFDTVVYPYVEAHAGYTEGTVQWTPHSGIQYAEIDGGTNHDVSQVLATIPGNTYTLSYWLSPRPTLSSVTNVMNVFANGVQIDTYTGTGLETTTWSQKTVTFTATTTVTRISFTQGQNVHKGEGVFLDDVSVVCNPVAIPVNTPVNPPANQCVMPDALGDTTSETIGMSFIPTEPTLTQIVSDYGMTISTTTGIQQYQSWTLSPAATTSLTVKYMGGATGNGNIFGYYVNNNISTFVPLFLSGDGVNALYASTSRATNGQVFTISVKASSVQFAVKSSGQSGIYTTSTVNTENIQGSDRAVVFNTPDASSHNDFVIAFEDLAVSVSDNDYNDVVVQVIVTGCVTAPVVNTPPTISLVGNNPIILTAGGTFTDPGATAHDVEDGNITNKIVVTGTVNPQVPGTYVLTYTVTDTGGLSASTIRTVIVLPVTACVVNANMITNGGFEKPVVNNPALWTSIPLGTPDFFWTSFDTVVYPYVEAHAGYTEGTVQWTPHSGIQYAEIDGGTNHDVSQVLATIPGNTYTLSYWLSPRPTLSSVTNVMNVFANGVQIDTYTGTGLETTTWSQKTVTFTATTTVTRISFTQGQNVHKGEGVFLDDVSVVCNPVAIPVNTPPTITLIGANPANLTVGQAWVEPGATANDQEDGNITNKIIITGTVNVNVVGTYPLVYTVTDTGGLSASTTRQVIVNPAGGGGVTTGSITFCSLYANKDNVIATSSLSLPVGTFSIKLASTSDIANSTIQSKTWAASSFAPNKKVISVVNDADCVTYSDLALGTYYYSELGVSGQQWIVSTTSPRYNDQLTTPVNNIFDFFAYSGALFTATTTDDASRNVNSDGQIVVSADRREHTLVMLTSYDAATTTPPVEPPACTSNCGGGPSTPPGCSANCGGGGGGNGPIVSSLSITNEKVVEITPGVALVTWNTNLPATKEVGYGNASQPASFIVAPFGYATSTARVSSPLETIHSYTIAIEKGKTYYFRPVSTDFKTTVAGIELVLNPGTSTGGNGGGNNGGSASCYYLIDWLKAGWNNNPVEVKKLQVFLRDLEGYPVQVTGVYDEQTITSLNAFQMKYKDDVLTPWGHTAPTSFTYITTKKKVNEIYCKMAFPVTAQEQKEIDAYRTFLQGLINAGVTVDAPTESQLNQPPFIDTTDVGVLPGLSTSTPGIGQGTLAGAEANSTSTIGRLTANVIASSKKIGNFMVALFTWPWDWAKVLFGGNDDLECSPTSMFSNWFNWILVIIILTMSYLWYRERRENEKAVKLNEELELLNK